MKFDISILTLFANRSSLLSFAQDLILSIDLRSCLLSRSHLLSLLWIDSHHTHLSNRAINILPLVIHLLFTLSILAMRSWILSNLSIIMHPIGSIDKIWIITNLMSLYLIPELIWSELYTHTILSIVGTNSTFFLVLEHLLSQVVWVSLLHLSFAHFLVLSLVLSKGLNLPLILNR